MANGRLSFIGQGGAGLLSGTTQTPVPGTAGQADDPSAALVQELLTRLSGGRPQPPQRPGTARSIVGALGDALLAAGAARLGQTTQTPGPFIRGVQQRQLLHEQQLADFEERRTRDLLSLAQLQAQTQNRQVQLEQQQAQREIQNELALTRLGLERERVAVAERNAQTAEERLALQQRLGEINAQMRQIGLDIGQQRLELGRQALEFGQQQKLNRPLPASLTTDISEAREASDAAETALNEWTRLGKPDLGLLFSLTSGRIADPRALEARRVIAEALLPIRKYFSGTAVSESERKEAEPIIARLEGGVAPRVLEQSIKGLISMARRKERSLLRDAELAGFNVSGFQTGVSPAAQRAPSSGGITVTIGPDGKLRRQ